MADSRHITEMSGKLNVSIDEAYYLAARAFATVVMAGLLLFMPESLVASRTALIVGTITATAGWAPLAFAVYKGRVVDAMMDVLLIDLMGVAALVYALNDFADQAYPPLVALALLYGLTQPRRRAAIASAGIATTYIGAQTLLVPGEIQLGRLAMVALASLTLLALSILVSLVVEGKRRRERDASEATARAERINVELEERVHELQTLQRISEAIHSTLELSVMGPKVLAIIAGWLGIETCSLFVLDRQSRDSIMTADFGYAEDEPHASVPIVDRADVYTADVFACLTVFENHAMRVVLCAHPDDLAKVTTPDRAILATACSEMVVAADNSRLYQLTKTLAVTDELTGLYNYRYLQQELEKQMDRARRYPSSLSFIMFDIDNFKAFNDAHGHVAGDQVLGEVGRVARSVTRDVDIVARYGGEEFSVILPETNAHGAYVAAEKIRQAIERHVFTDVNGNTVSGLTVSIGLATFPTHAWDHEALLREADNALYHAKNGGKNRIRTPQAITAAGLADTFSSEAAEESES